MKIIFRKLRRVNLAKKITYFFTAILYLCCLIYFILGLLHLTKIETFARILVIIFFCIWFFIYIFGGLLSLFSRKTRTFIFITFISLICCPVFVVSSFVIHQGINIARQMNRDEIEYTSKVIALKDTSFNSSSIIGMIEAEDDISGYQLAHILIEKNNLSNKIKYYEEYSQMISDLYDGKIDGCFVPGEFDVTFKNEVFEYKGKEYVNLSNGTKINKGSIIKKGRKENEETEEDTNYYIATLDFKITGNFENDFNNYLEIYTPIPINERVKVLYEYSEVRKNQDVETLSDSKTKELTEPFTILVMGVDSSSDGLKANQAFNGDTLIMITFNPDTLTATMFSIPRDLYVPIACNRNRYNKINSSAAYGSSCVISTVQQLTDIKIDFYVKVNFKGVVDLVDALGGVTVDVQTPDFNYNAGVNCNGKVCEQNSNREFGSNMIYITPGTQHLNGEEALAYSRNRHQYALSDIARNQHQQDIILAMAQELKTIKSYSDFENILKTISKNIETNLTTDQILSFYNVGKNMIPSSNNETKSLSIKRTQLSYYGLTVWNGYNASALGYYQESLNAITKLMKVNLGQEQEEDIKTFKISFNEEYTTPLIGEKLYGGTKLQTLPNHVGQTKDTVSAWCLNNGITCNFKAVDSESNYGIIIEQSVHENSLLKTISEVTYTYSNASLQPNKPTTNPNDNDKNNNNNNGNSNSNNNNNDDEDENNDDNDENNNNNTVPEQTPDPIIPTPNEDEDDDDEE